MSERPVNGARDNIARLAELLPPEGSPLTPERREAFMGAGGPVLDLFYPESTNPGQSWEVVVGAETGNTYIFCDGELMDVLLRGCVTGGRGASEGGKVTAAPCESVVKRDAGLTDQPDA